MENIVKKDVFLKISLKIPETIKQPIIIPTIIIPPRKSPDKIIPPGTFVNFRSNVAKSPIDRSPKMIFRLRSVVIITDNVPTPGEGVEFKISFICDPGSGYFQIFVFRKQDSDSCARRVL